jgi:ssRNA-specific RNase YbeY (16S rRNA maturation enzyme)
MLLDGGTEYSGNVAQAAFPEWFRSVDPSPELAVVVLNRQRRQRIDATRLRRVLRRAGQTLGVGGEVSVVLAGDRLLRRLNRDFRGKDRPTDVLSFPGAGGEEGLGDVVISVPTAAGGGGRRRSR